MNCPRCGSTSLYRSRSRSRWESWRKRHTNKMLCRCHICLWRGWISDDFEPRGKKLQNFIAYLFMVSVSIGVTVLLLPLLE